MQYTYNFLLLRSDTVHAYWHRHLLLQLCELLFPVTAAVAEVTRPACMVLTHKRHIRVTAPSAMTDGMSRTGRPPYLSMLNKQGAVWMTLQG